MGLLQKAVETYDAHAALVGRVEEGHEVLAPVSHIITAAQIEIVLDKDGNFCDAASVEKNEAKIVIPVTEESAGRTSAPCAHPLCDQLCYLAPYNAEKHDLYLKQLADWAESEFGYPKLKPILHYIEGGTILSDLSQRGIIKLNENGIPEKEKDMVRWRVIGMDDGRESACWMDKTLFDAFIRYYAHLRERTEQSICMITGTISPAASQHPKGIIPINGNAKLISANDSSGFTYRGRFSDSPQAVTVSYEASQKAHNALRWLAAEQGVQIVFGGRTFLCWNPQGKKVCGVTGPFRKNTAAQIKPSDYQKALWETLLGYQTDLHANDSVVIAAFDAATTGRLSLTYYNELLGSDFLQRLYHWDMCCCWPNGQYGIQSPPLFQIVNCAFGVQREEKGKAVLKTDDRILCQQMQRLVSCRIDQSRIPYDLVSALVNRASTPQSYDPAIWRKILFTACAVLNKYETERKGVDEMSWNLDEPDRSFQYGRLLAVMERAEQDYYYKTQEDRQTSAIKAMAEFRRKPWSTYERINFHLNQAYLPRIDSWRRQRYGRLTDEIVGLLSLFPKRELNKPLSDIYLMGYHLQHEEFYKPKDENKQEGYHGDSEK